jgi:hypothetical protein
MYDPMLNMTLYISYYHIYGLNLKSLTVLFFHRTWFTSFCIVGISLCSVINQSSCVVYSMRLHSASILNNFLEIPSKYLPS